MKVILTVFAAAVSFASVPVLKHDRSFSPGHPVSVAPKFENGHFLAYDLEQSVVWSSDATGRVVTSAHLALPEAGRFLIKEVAAKADGTLVVATSAYSVNGQGASLLIWISPSGAVLRTVRTSPFAAFTVAFAGDGTLWALGRALPEHDMIRRYNSNGKLIQSLLPKSTFHSDASLLYRECRLAPFGDRVGLYSGRTREWIELSLSGEVLERRVVAEVPETLWVTGVAVVNGRVFFSGQMKGGGRSSFYTLDRSSWEFAPVAEERARGGGVIGSDGGRVVVYADRAVNWLRVD
jgi:hypothetical protein